MSMTKAVRITAKILEARDALRRLFGGQEFAYRVRDWQEVIRHTMTKNHCSELVATMEIVRNLQQSPDTGMVQMWVLAAVAEMLEPS